MFPLVFHASLTYSNNVNKLLGFDPLLFLEIKNLNGDEKTLVSKYLLNKISQYLLIRISEILPAEDTKFISEPDELFTLAQNKISNLNDKVKIFLGDFKKEFSNNLVVK